jgi:hypothetical protein
MHVLMRGDPEEPREAVGAGAVAILGGGEMAIDSPESARRVAFANWVASSANPLTARVAVNRLWQHHFGIGLVDTPGDFGAVGSRPTHPELLDWLAREFVARALSNGVTACFVSLSAVAGTGLATNKTRRDPIGGTLRLTT